MKIGLTGSTGILGSQLIKKLNIKKRYLFVGKIENLNQVNKWIKMNNFDYIIHLAAIVPTNLVNKNKTKAFKVNYLGTRNLVNSINKNSKKKIWFFYASTSHVYNFKKTKIYETDRTNPISYYGKTKLKGEKYVLSNQKMYDACIGRIFSFTSKKQNKSFIIPSIISKLKNSSKNILLENLNHDRDFLKLDDITLIISKILKKKLTGIYNICSGKKINLIEILHTLNKKYKKSLTIKKNSKKTILYGSNKKLINSISVKQTANFLNYIHKNY